MWTILRISRIIYSKKRFQKLLIPVCFLVMELAVAVILNWQLFGEHYEFNDSSNQQQASIHCPLIVINSFHSERISHPYGSSTETQFIHLYNEKYLLKTLCFLSSLMFAYIGILVAMLWIKRFFKQNNLNIRWWQWPIACLGAHGILYLIANSAVQALY